MMNYMEHEEHRDIAPLEGEASWTAPEGSPFEPLPRETPLEGEAQDSGTEGPEAPLPGGLEEDLPGDSPAPSEAEPASEIPEAAPPGDDAGIEEAAPPEPEKPKRRRTSRKKAAEVPEEPTAGETGPDGAAIPEAPAAPEANPDGAGPGQGPLAEEAGEANAEQDAETSAFVLEEADGLLPPETPDEARAGEGLDNGGAEDEPEGPLHAEEPEAPPAQPARPRRARRSSAAAGNAAPGGPFAQRPLNDKAPLLSLDLNKLDQELTEEEREEWNAIYASYRSKSLLTGHIVGIDSHSFAVRNRETGRTERRRMLCAVIISYRVKVLIPEAEIWLPEQERPPYVLRSMPGAEIDYVILDVDREGGVAIGSRRIAALARQHFFDTAKNGHEIGEKLPCRVLSVGPKRCLVECGGRDLNLSQRDLTYTATPDLRVKYHPGQTLDCILKQYDRRAGQFWVSVKETMPNPFFGAVKRHPIGSRRQAVISGKYGGGVFCTLPDDTVCLCLYSTRHSDSDFHVGDTVILVIRQIDYDRKLIYGRILSKW